MRILLKTARGIIKNQPCGSESAFQTGIGCYISIGSISTDHLTAEPR